MGQKLHRNRHVVFKRRSRLPGILLWVVIASVIVSGGFFGAKYLNEHPFAATGDNPQPNETTTTTSGTTAPAPDTGSPVSEEIRAFYLPFSALQDRAALSGTLSEAATAGFNAVIFDMKDSDGHLYYRSATGQAVTVNSFVENALTADELKDLFNAIKSSGLQPIPQLFAFMDTLGARALPGARISHQSNPSWVWYDAAVENGGKAWLNPYADEAQLYIISLATELRDSGAAAILLDGVRFPTQTAQASFGSSSNTGMSHDAILTAFVSKTQQSLGDSCPVILASTCEGALGTNTGIYGNNPLTFGANFDAPSIFPGSLNASVNTGSETVVNAPEDPGATVQAIVRQMVLRTKVIDADSQPRLAPWLQAYGYTAEQIAAEISGCKTAGTDSFILYNPDGDYAFSSLKN